MEKEELKGTLEFYLKYLENINENKNYIPTQIELNYLYKLSNEKNTNINLNNLLGSLRGEKNPNKRKKLVDKFIIHQISENIEEKKRLISKIYNVNQNEIEHRKLQDDQEVFLFYDDKMGRKRIIKNCSNLEFSNQLKNSENKNSEITMLNIPEIYNHPEVFKDLTSKELSNIKLLIEKVKALNLKYIDIKRQIALDNSNNLFEAYFDLEENMSKIVKPKEIVYDTQVSKKTNNFSNVEIDPEILNEINNYKISNDMDVQEVYNRIKYYHNNIKEIDLLPEGEEKEFYKRMVVFYAVRNKRNKNVKKFTFERPSVYKAGYVNIFIVTIITLLVLLILGIIYRLN